MDTKRRRGSGTCCFYYPPRKWQKQGQKGTLSFLFKNFLSYIFPALCRSYVEKMNLAARNHVKSALLGTAS